MCIVILVMDMAVGLQAQRRSREVFSCPGSHIEDDARPRRMPYTPGEQLMLCAQLEAQVRPGMWTLDAV